MRRAVPRVVVLGVVTVVLAACGANLPPPVPDPDPTPTAVVVPAGGVSLADLGFEHGPVDAITLPVEVRLGVHVDQPNAVTMVFQTPDGTVIAAWLRKHLPEGGFRITAASAAGMTFEGYAWSGAFTVAADTSALSLRRVPPAGPTSR